MVDEAAGLSSHPPAPKRGKGFAGLEWTILVASVVVVAYLGDAAHRWMWAQAALLNDRSAMQDVVNTLRTMRLRAMARTQRGELRVDAERRVLQFVMVEQGAHAFETVMRTLWLPEDLELSEAPAVVSVLPSGALSPASIITTAPSYQRAFRLTTDGRGAVRLDEEPTS